MKAVAIGNLNLFKIVDATKAETYYGCQQSWYPKQWQRLSGCGPTVATNLFFYLCHNQAPLQLEEKTNTKENWISLMEEMWEYVTPTRRGVNTTERFYESLQSFLKAKGLEAGYRFCNVAADKSQRPGFGEILDFIAEALTKDSPVAFLNLCNGKVENLDRWHWVTLISLDYSEDGSRAFANILDEGQIKRIDLALWFETTTLGGGFVYFMLE